MKHFRSSLLVLFACTACTVADNLSYTEMVTELDGIVTIAGEGWRQDFQSNVAIEAGIASAVHFTHSAGAQGASDFIRADACARIDRHVPVSLSLPVLTGYLGNPGSAFTSCNCSVCRSECAESRSTH